MLLNLDPRSNTPIWEQVVHQIKELILKEILQPEDKLPSVRELSGTLLINPNTVSKAYQELERQGIIETLRGKGTFVSASITPKADEQKIAEMKQQFKQLVIDASYLGIDQQTLSLWLKEITEELGGNNDND
ncbi:GntR family transcriptional regulator [Fictibacillus phosphorivorans]|uniref:GntR family transcriptional regulator n=1 Tax=Fictibacillus phosphorivorans TaxID=1221500 RepID=UPI0020411C88|nr:GntR family transcriptional regulator [Fictibacillus phosphorivorans]MCM3717436.1 GntR family transcriptional regulator [Fictibacillus phosphorivorans]MCM3775131.1 GntR family transcriptional regulator [Fictibacillus phosphorivorans]